MMPALKPSRWPSTQTTEMPHQVEVSSCGLSSSDDCMGVD